jgi:hypothetical protein
MIGIFRVTERALFDTVTTLTHGSEKLLVTSRIMGRLLAKLLHRDLVYEMMLNAPVVFQDYRRNTHFVKRIFRVVPLNFARSL